MLIAPCVASYGSTHLTAIGRDVPVTHSTPDREDAARPRRWPLSKLRNSLKADDDHAKRKSPGLGRGRSGLLRDGTGLGAPGDFRPTSIQYISRGGDVTWITSFRFSLTV